MAPSKIVHEISNHLDFWFLSFDFWFLNWFLNSNWLLILSTNLIQAVILCLDPCLSYQKLESWSLCRNLIWARIAVVLSLLGTTALLLNNLIFEFLSKYFRWSNLELGNISLTETSVEYNTESQMYIGIKLKWFTDYLSGPVCSENKN